jgi:hypothetical protein
VSNAEEILEYIFIEHVSGPDFFSAIARAESQSDISSILRYSVQDAIASYGYRTTLWYDSVMRKHLDGIAGYEGSRYSISDSRKKTIYDKIFNFEYDSYFGERIRFDANEFIAFISSVVAHSKSHQKIASQIKKFGKSGLRKALERVAQEHKWAQLEDDAVPLGDGSVLSVESKEATLSFAYSRKFLLSPTESSRVVEEIRSLKTIVENSELTQEQHTQAVMLIDAALILSQMPTPNWRIVRELLYLVAAISTVLGVSLQIAEMIK